MQGGPADWVDREPENVAHQDHKHAVRAGGYLIFVMTFLSS
jgi:hypothetical protein